MQSSSLLGTGESRMLAKGAVVTAEDGTQYTVGDLLGHGGQGEVYRISGFDGDFALKWYYSDTGSRYLNRINSEAFRKNLEKNVHDGVPTTTAGSQASQFIWPLKMVPPQGNGKSFGYIMNLYKPGYYKFSEIIMGMHKGQPLHMKSWNMLVTAALNIVRGFEILHAKGLSYQDLNEGGVFINPETGDVMICDCDNVSPTG